MPFYSAGIRSWLSFDLVGDLFIKLQLVESIMAYKERADGNNSQCDREFCLACDRQWKACECPELESNAMPRAPSLADSTTAIDGASEIRRTNRRKRVKGHRLRDIDAGTESKPPVLVQLGELLSEVDLADDENDRERVSRHRTRVRSRLSWAIFGETRRTQQGRSPPRLVFP